MGKLILQILNVLMQTSVCYYFVITLSEILTNKVYSKKNFIILSLFFLVIISIGMILKSISMIINVIIIELLLFCALRFLFKISTVKSLLFAVFFFVFLAITELIAAYFGIFLFKEDVALLRESTIKTTVIIVFQAILCFGLTYLFKLLAKKYFPKESFLVNVNSKQLVDLVLLVFICLVPQLLLFSLKLYNYSLVFLVINSIQIIMISFVLIIYFKRTVERDKTLSDLFTSELHNKTMVGMVDGVRTLKHDYNNIMQSLNGYIATKQYDKLQEHINELLDECNIINNLSIIDPKIFNHPAIYGIVGAKYFLATESNIKFDLDIITNINEICFPMPDLSRILGILIDNAIEATQKTNKPYIRLEMKYDNRKCSDVIRIINTYDNSINIELSQIYKKGFSSKKIKSGIGLWEVKNLVNKVYNSQIFGSIENGKFIQTLIIEKI